MHKDHDKKVIQISLSPVGKKYLAYMTDQERVFLQSQVDKITTKNCEAVINSIPISLVKGIPQSVKFSDITPKSARNIQFTYNQTIYEIKRVNSQPYPVNLNYYDLLRKEGNANGGEEYRVPKLSIQKDFRFVP